MIIALAVIGILVVTIVAAWRCMIWMPGSSWHGTPVPLDKCEKEVCEAMRSDLTVLAGDIGERNMSRRFPQLLEAAGFIERSLASAGYATRRQEFDVGDKTVWNVEAERPGHGSPEKIIVLGAHYDTVAGSPGANDNGSAVVANLALARAFAELSPRRTIRFVFFVNEEFPYYMTAAMGSLQYAEACRSQQEELMGMISLETIGCYTDAPHSQRYPLAVLRHLYPTAGNFLAIVGNVRSRHLVHQVLRGLRETPFPTEGIAAPRWLKDIFRSDHAAFWHCGYPALMATDTANFRYPFYHSAEDTVDKINYEALARVVTGLRVAVWELGGK